MTVFSASPVVRITLVRDMSDRGRAGERGEGNTRPCPPLNGRACSSTVIAASLSGTRCGLPAFMRSPGIVHVFASVSISFQVAPRASPLRAAQRIRKRKQSLDASDAPEASTVSSAAATSPIGQRPEVLPLRPVGRGKAPSMASPATLCGDEAHALAAHAQSRPDALSHLARDLRLTSSISASAPRSTSSRPISVDRLFTDDGRRRDAPFAASR